MLNVQDFPAVKEQMAELTTDHDRAGLPSTGGQQSGYPAKKLVLKDGVYRPEKVEK